MEGHDRTGVVENRTLDSEASSTTRIQAYEYPARGGQEVYSDPIGLISWK